MSALLPDGVHPSVVRKRQVNARFDARTRVALEQVAVDSDRQVSQLVRYAVSDWIADEDRAYPVLGSDGPSEFVNVRLDSADVDVLDVLCDEAGVSRSMAVRCAVRVWLVKVTGEGGVAFLGAPSSGVVPVDVIAPAVDASAEPADAPAAESAVGGVA